MTTENPANPDCPTSPLDDRVTELEQRVDSIPMAVGALLARELAKLRAPRVGDDPLHGRLNVSAAGQAVHRALIDEERLSLSQRPGRRSTGEIIENALNVFLAGETVTLTPPARSPESPKFTDSVTSRHTHLGESEFAQILTGGELNVTSTMPPPSLVSSSVTLEPHHVRRLVNFIAIQFGYVGTLPPDPIESVPYGSDKDALCPACGFQNGEHAPRCEAIEYYCTGCGALVKSRVSLFDVVCFREACAGGVMKPS